MSEKNKGGRPLIEIDEEEVLKLAQLGCTVQEMADFFGCSRDVLERRFSGVYQKGFATAKMSLRRQMLAAVDKGSVPMAIWLSKQWLGMKEPKQEIDFSTGVDEITFTDDKA